MGATVLLPQRLPDWPERLAAFVEARRHVPFAWGSNDCATLAADAVLATTGADPMAALRGRWASEEEAGAVLQSMGGLAAAARRVLGRPLDVWQQAGRGAVVCANMQGQCILGVSLGAVWCAPGAAGLLFRSCAEVRLAWSV